MECVCARPDGVRMCIWDAVCAHLRARVTGHKPVCLCVSLGVSQRGSGCRDGVLEGVCFGWGYRECSNPEAPDRAGVSACGAVSSPCPPPLPTKAGPAVPGLSGSCSLSLSPTLSQRFLSLEALSHPQPGQEWFRARRWQGLRGPPRAGSRQGRAAAPARGEARPRGPRAARQAARAAPLPPPRLPRGAHPSTGGGGRPGPAPNAPTACAPAREWCPSASRSPSPRALLRAPAASRSSESPRPRPPPPTPRVRAGYPRPGGPGKKA